MTSREIAMRRRTRRRGVVQRQGTNNRRRGFVVVAAALAIFLFLVATVAAGAAMYGIQRYNEIAETVVPAEELIDGFSRGGARIYDRNGELLYEFVDEFGGLRRPVSIENMSDHLITATIATEDNDFYTNRGVNTRGLVRAGLENFTPFLGDDEFFEGTGGSSITQQLAKNIYIPREQRTERSVDRKIQETVIALELTEQYSKDQILEWYLNSIAYGGIYTGIQAAAEGYFDKPASELTLAEAALLAGIPQSPAQYYPLSAANFDVEAGQLAPASLAKARQSEVLDLMVRHGHITPDEAEEARQEPLQFRQRNFDIEAPHWVLGRIADEVTARWGERALFEWGLEITTTIDMDLQRIAEEIVDRNVREYGTQANLHNGAFIAIDPHTGQILTYLASRDYFNQDIEGQNDNIMARNSPGSTLKPFTFMGAFMRGWGTGTAILDTPVTYTDEVGNTFTPRNPGTGFRGPVTTAEALGNSYNVTATKTMDWVGVGETVDLYKQLGFTTLDNPGGYGVALTTGGGEVSLMDQAIAYSVLATGGVMRGQELASTELEPDERSMEAVALLRVVSDEEVLYEFEEPDEQRIVDSAYTYLVSDILSDPQNTCITYGECGALSLPNGYPSAAKTGTSEPFNQQGLIGETWTMGYTPELVAGIWAGNSDNDPIQGISSTTVALRSWQEFMVAAIDHMDLPPTQFERPADVVSREVCWPSGRLPSDACPDLNRYTSLFAEAALSEAETDSWWQSVAIDTRTGLVAFDNTPSEFISEDFRLVMPENEISGWGGLQAWAQQHNVTQYLGTSAAVPSGPHPAQITIPSANAVVSGEVDIRGRATSDDFVEYAVEWGQGSDPSSWNLIDQSSSPVSSGLLGTWDTNEVSDGTYTIRVRVEDESAGTRYFAIPVEVENDGAEPEPDDDDGGGGSGEAGITSPGQGAEVSGSVTITGTATSGDFLGYQLQVGEGDNPGDWTTLATSTDAVQNGTLGQWDASGVSAGTYTIRVQIVDQFFEDTEHRVTVTVGGGSGGGGGEDDDWIDLEDFLPGSDDDD